MNFFNCSAINRKILLMMVLPVLCISLFSLTPASAAPDTTWSVSFQLNMSKAVNQHIFMPDSDYVYLLMDHGMNPFKLVQGPGNIYTATLFNLLDSSQTYQYKFRINDSLEETVTRSFVPQPGYVSLSSWWNNEPINITTFTVNMSYAARQGIFNPGTDSVCIVGTMNSFHQSSKMQRLDTTLLYAWVDSLLIPGSVQQYKYRINADSGGLELLFKPARFVRIPDTLLEVTSYFNNFNPATRPMTFQCNMSYYIQAHFFDIQSDHLDIAGNFNGMGANDALFDPDGNSIYSLEMNLDTAWFQQGPLEFKFRINGNWNTAELPGNPDRTYIFHDTIQQNPNIFNCYYNNLNPTIPTPPWVYDVYIQGLLVYKRTLSGSYSYSNVNGIPEGISTYRWLRSANAQGTDATPIDSAWKITYVVDTLDIGKWLVFEVTPIAASGDSATGEPVRVVTSNSISGWNAGIDEHSLIARVYPNPASDFLIIQGRKEFERIELINYLNQTVLVEDNIGSSSVRLPIAQLSRGLYVLKATTKASEWGVIRVVKY
ncbi:MAG: T9SS type A sorting domain-containing protein [Bacteroidetes bacterium]|nr:T9SS type A sorting domain-containing protein [Bacteroidota bacterium]